MSLLPILPNSPGGSKQAEMAWATVVQGVSLPDHAVMSTRPCSTVAAASSNGQDRQSIVKRKRNSFAPSGQAGKPHKPSHPPVHRNLMAGPSQVERVNFDVPLVLSPNWLKGSRKPLFSHPKRLVSCQFSLPNKTLKNYSNLLIYNMYVICLNYVSSVESPKDYTGLLIKGYPLAPNTTSEGIDIPTKSAHPNHLRNGRQSEPKRVSISKPRAQT